MQPLFSSDTISKIRILRTNGVDELERVEGVCSDELPTWMGGRSADNGILVHDLLRQEREEAGGEGGTA